MQVVESWGGCLTKKRCTVNLNCVFLCVLFFFSETHRTFQGKKHEVETPSFVQGGFVEFVLLLIIAKKNPLGLSDKKHLLQQLVAHIVGTQLMPQHFLVVVDGFLLL